MTKMPETLDISDGSGLSTQIPRYLRVLIADAIIAFSRLEHCMSTSIWSYLKLDPREGRVFTNIGFDAKRRLARRLFRDRYDNSEYEIATSNIWPKLDNIAFDRNVLAHGRLFMYENRLLVGVLDRPMPEPEAHKGRIFDQLRLTQLRNIADHLSEMFSGLTELYADVSFRPLIQIDDRTDTALIDESRRLSR